MVDIKTSLGTITVELDADKAPKTVENFLAYVDKDYYSGLIFHRVIAGFMIQGGGFTRDFEKRETRPPIQNEADNGLKNLKGTIAMARTGEPHSATGQFYISLEDNGPLDHRSKTRDGWGYAVFGTVTSGMDVVERIGGVRVGANGPFSQDCPLEPVVIESITRRAEAQ